MQFLWIPFALIFVIMVGLCTFLGYRKGWFKGVLGLAFNIVAVALAFGLTKLVADGNSKHLIATVNSIVTNLIRDESVKSLLTMESAETFVKLFVQFGAALVLFPPLYLIFYFLMKIPQHIIKKKVLPEGFSAIDPEAEEDENTPIIQRKIVWLGPVACALSAVVSFGAMFSIPTGSVTSMAAIPLAHESIANIQIGGSHREAKLPTMKEMQAASNSVSASANLSAVLLTATTRANDKTLTVGDLLALANHPFFRATAIMGAPTYYGLAHGAVQEITSVEEIACSVYDFIAAPTAEGKIEALNGIREGFNTSDVLASFIAESVSTVASVLLEGDSFLGFSISSSDQMTSEIYRSLLTNLAEATPESIKSDVDSVINLTEKILSNETLSQLIVGKPVEGSTSGETESVSIGELMSADNLTKIVSDREALEDFLKTVLSNSTLAASLPAIAQASMNQILSGMGLTIPADVDTTIDLDVTKMTEAEINNEAAAIAKSLSEIVNFMNAHQGFVIDFAPQDDVKEFIKILSGLDHSIIARGFMDKILPGVANSASRNFPEKEEALKSATTLTELYNVLMN